MRSFARKQSHRQTDRESGGGRGKGERGKRKGRRGKGSIGIHMFINKLANK